jgi:hypothetical protein
MFINTTIRTSDLATWGRGRGEASEIFSLALKFHGDNTEAMEPD